MKIVLSIAGDDPSAGAGIQGDLKTFLSFNVYGMSAITALTSQNSTGVKNIYPTPSEILKDQLDTLSQDFKFDAIKIGMIYTSENVMIVKNFIKDKKNIVIDPIIYSSNNIKLIEENALECIKNELFHMATVITPNTMEASAISGIRIKDIEGMKIAAYNIKKKLNVNNILIKGGESGTDLLYTEDSFEIYKAMKLNIDSIHGTGCALSSAIASGLANGLSIKESVREAKNYITVAIKNSFKFGKGANLLSHLRYTK